MEAIAPGNRMISPTSAPPIHPLGGPIDKASPVPLYFQIAENLRDAIERELLRPGDLLDNELELCERLGVSRPTIRQAIQRLVHEGFLTRRRGVGTVVLTRRIQRPLALTSLFEDLTAAGRTPTTTVVASCEEEAVGDVARSLGLPEGAPVIRIERVRSVDGSPLAVMRNHIPAGLLRDVKPEVELMQTGLYQLLRRQGVELESAEQAIGARKVTSEEAELLQVRRGTTVLTMSRIAFDKSRDAVEYGRHAYLADRYSFRVALPID